MKPILQQLSNQQISMSFLQELKNSRKKLRKTETLVTCIDGKKYIENNSFDSNNVRIISQNTLGYVVDTNPDDLPALVKPNLYVGSQDCTSSETLTEYQIKTVLSIGIEAPVKIPTVEYHFCELLDLPESNLISAVYLCKGIIKRSLDRNEKVLVHCNAGVSRSVSVVVAFLILDHGMSYEDAFALVKDVRPCARPNQGFLKQLANLHFNSG